VSKFLRKFTNASAISFRPVSFRMDLRPAKISDTPFHKTAAPEH